MRKIRRSILIWMINPQTLPHDFDPDDLFTAGFYRFSVALNRTTGGPADMTFSARCHRNATRERTLRSGWALLAGVIDFGFATARGELCHCAAAWENYQNRTWPAGVRPLNSGPTEAT